ncbi:MAG: GAF domain-containing protein [Lachnospiraceae bacterium]|nr:GAF domain-containing protein [Lachnospiraceae bacterium]
MKEITKEQLIDIAISISSEKDMDVLMERILTEAMDYTECDGGTLYICTQENLEFHTAITRSKNFHMSKRIGNMVLPPVPYAKTHVCACCAMEKKKINIPDVYESTDYDFHGAQKYDSMNDYRTKSMLVLPMEDEKGNVIGVLQFINATDEGGSIVPFPSECEQTISALSSLAAVSLNNHQLSEQVLELLHSFVKVMASAIDTRSPYNANHSRSMARYAEKFIKWLNEADGDWKFEEKDIDPFIMSVWLHDVGKLVIPLEVMDKPTRLGDKEERFVSKVTTAILMERLRGYEHPEEKDAADEKIKALKEAKELILSANGAGFLPDDKLEAIKKAASIECLTADGESVPFLNEEELTCMMVRKGTLTDEERKIMQSHVINTEKMLSQMIFKGDYANVPVWAASHHEFLNGSGYPKHLKAEDLPKETRLLTILDVYDALTAEDRPYKPAMPTEKAFGILHAMEQDGQLDGKILDLFEKSGVWKKEPKV